MKLRICLPILALAFAGVLNGQTYIQENLLPLTQGSFWVYDNGHVSVISSVTESYGALSVTFSNRTSSGSSVPGYMTLRAESSKIQSTGYGNPYYIIVDGDMGYYPFLQRPVYQGRSWNVQSYSNGYPIYQAIQVTSMDMPVTIRGVTYEHCAEVTVITSYPSGYTPGQVKWVNSRYYFYPSVGCIKRVLTSDQGATDVIQAIAWDVKGFNSQPIAITEQPESKTAATGSSVRMSVKAVGPGTLRCQWYKNASKLGASTRITGTTSTNLNISALTAGDAGNYYIVITNSYGSVTSSVATLEVVTPPATFELAEYFNPIVQGNQWTFTGTDYDGSPCWRFETIADTSVPVTAYTGRTAPQPYTTNLVRILKGYGAIGSDTPYDTWDDFFSATSGQIGFWGDDDDSESLRTDGGLLMPKTVKVGGSYSSTRDVYSQGHFAGTVSMKITIMSWASVVVPAGMFKDCLRVRLTFVIGGQSQVQEEWWARDIGPVKHRNVPDNGEEQLDLVSYSVVTPPKITVQPENVTAVEGFPASLSVAAEGSGQLSYQWFKDGEVLGWATSDTLQITSVTSADVGSYYVVVQDDNGSITSEAAVLSLGAEQMPPTLEITSHFEEQLVSTSTIALSGVASDLGQGSSGIAWVKVNGLRATGDTATGSGTANWSRTLALAQGLNTVKVIAADGNRNLATNIIHINVDSARPRLVVTYPAVGQRVTNAFITAKGRASDRNLADVWCRLNEGEWFQPIGTTNWTADLELTPGTNILSAFAVDTAGNISYTNRVKFVYVVYAPLEVYASAGGIVKPNYNGKWLQVGKRYSISAVAATGFKLLNWTDGGGNELTNRPTLIFTMASNLVLNANFVDAQRPVVAITSPSSSAKALSSSFTATGTARDNSGLVSVLCRLNDGAWQLATGTEQWSFSCELESGPNTLSVCAFDAEGNCSVTNRVSVTCLKDLLTTYWPMYNNDYKTFSGPIGAVTMSIFESWGDYTMTLDFPDETVKAYYQYGSGYSQLLLTGGRYGWSGFSFNPDIVELTDSQLANGGSRKTTSSISVSGQAIPVSVTTTVSSVGTVTVPIGTYQDCKRVSVSVVATAGGQTSTFSAESYIVAPRVGIIKVGVYKSSASGMTLVGWEQLTGGTVNGVDVGNLAASVSAASSSIQGAQGAIAPSE